MCYNQSHDLDACQGCLTWACGVCVCVRVCLQGFADEVALGYLWVCYVELKASPSSLPASCSTAFTK